MYKKKAPTPLVSSTIAEQSPMRDAWSISGKTSYNVSKLVGPHDVIRRGYTEL